MTGMAMRRLYTLIIVNMTINKPQFYPVHSKIITVAGDKVNTRIARIADFESLLGAESLFLHAVTRPTEKRTTVCIRIVRFMHIFPPMT